MEALEKENRQLQRQLKQAETIIEVQNKISEILHLSTDPKGDIQKDVKVIIRPLDGSFKFGNIPGPDLVRTCGQKFRGLINRMTKLIPTLPDFSLLVQDPIHAPHRAKVGPFIEHGGIDLPGRLIDKPIRVQEIQNLLPLFWRQGPRGNGSLPLRGVW